MGIMKLTSFGCKVYRSLRPLEARRSTCFRFLLPCHHAQLMFSASPSMARCEEPMHKAAFGDASVSVSLTKRAASTTMKEQKTVPYIPSQHETPDARHDRWHQPVMIDSGRDHQ